MEKIEKLELKHLCGYLPYGLNLKIDTSEWFEKRESFIARFIGVFDQSYLTVKYIDETDTTYTDNMGRFKPLLLPLSALTDPMENGSVPIVELLKPNVNIDTKYLRWVGSTILFGNILLLNVENLNLSLNRFEYLYSRHFDIYGLIPAGLAIDKRTLNKTQ